MPPQTFLEKRFYCRRGVSLPRSTVPPAVWERKRTLSIGASVSGQVPPPCPLHKNCFATAKTLARHFAFRTLHFAFARILTKPFGKSLTKKLTIRAFYGMI